MSRRIEVELTSARDDGTWTWRAAGARQPKGVLDGGLLYSDAKVGDVVRADADFDVDGITVTAVLPPKGARPEPERLEVIGPEREFTPVTSTLAKGGRDDRGDRGDRRPRREGDRDRRPGPRSGPGGRPGAGRPDRGPRAEGDRGPRAEGDRGPRAEGERGARPDRPRRERPAPPPPRPKAKKLRPRRTHRDALLAALPPEQHPIAEQVLRGGMPAVRTALNEQNTKAKAEGKPEVPVPAVLAIAEDLLPRFRLAEWLDRAEAAAADAEELSLSDLRSVVVSADDVSRDERVRAMADSLKAVLDRRAPAELQQWIDDVRGSVTSGRVVRALRLAARPPRPNEVLPADLVTALVEAAGAALTAEIEPDRWATVLDAVAYSPVRRDVMPAGIPAEPGEELLVVVRKHAGRSPAIAALFGVDAPAPKGKGRPGKGRTRSGGAPARPAPAGPPVLGPGGRRIPPPPPRRPEPATSATSAAEAPSAPPEARTPEAAAEPAAPAAPAAPEAIVEGTAAAEAHPESPVDTPAAVPAEQAPTQQAPLADEPPASAASAPAAAPAPTPAEPVEPPAGTAVDAATTEATPRGDDPRAHGDQLLAPDGPPPSSPGDGDDGAASSS
ncbi:MAG TPA: hypothetical protein VMN58_04125 [Acidimicrobiales bacterium]|nr:hypothetical protein [Acidimicrobiales bacterium]